MPGIASAKLTYPKIEATVIIAYLNGSPHHLVISVIIQLSLAFGLAGLFWPDKFMPVFDVLMFPWAASYRTVRGHSIAALALSILLFFVLSSNH